MLFNVENMDMGSINKRGPSLPAVEIALAGMLDVKVSRTR
jgi:hypothetical protein